MKRTMKHILLSIFVLSICVSGVKAQSENSEVGIKGSVNFSNLYSDQVDDQDLRVGIQGGLFFKAGLTDFLAIQPELLFSQKGSTIKYDNFITGNAEFTTKLNYIEVPVLGVLNITENLNVHAGPYFAYLVNVGVENNAEDDSFNFVEDFNEDDFNRVDYGVCLGAALEFDVLRFGARFDYGLAEVGKEQSFSLDGSDFTSDQFKDLKNATLSVYLGIGF